jgi:cytochrome c oxidase assembly protein subunit 15
MEAAAWATPVHRIVASTLGLLVLYLNLIAFRTAQSRVNALLLLALTVFLATLGLRSGSLHSPAIVMGNLAGGFFMLGLLGWMVFSPVPTEEDDFEKYVVGNRPVNRWAMAALIILCAQIVLGGLTSANFAATACRTLPDCQGSWMPGSALMTAVDLSRQHVIDESGHAVGGSERKAIHKTHRLGALLTLATLLVAAIVALRSGNAFRRVAITIIVLVIAEFSVGIAAILTQLPIGLAVIHNSLAAFLLLSLIVLLVRNRIPGATEHTGGLKP